MRAPLLFACLIVLAPAAVRADSHSDAKAAFERASAAHKEGRFEDALTNLMTAYALEPRPELLYAIGQVHVKLGQCPQAITFYERFLASSPKPEHATRARQAIEVCKTNPPPREVQAADPTKPREELGPTAEEHLRKAAEAEAVVATERRRLEEARIAAERAREREKLYDRHPARIWAYVAGGVGIAGLAAGGYFAVSARNAQASFRDAGCDDRLSALPASAIATCQADAERGERDALIANIGLAAGGALVVTGALLFALDPGNVERPSTAPRVSITPRSIHFTARW